MELVVDANVLFSALIGRASTHELFFEQRIKLAAPLKLIVEFERNRELIAEKGRVPVQELMEAFEILKAKIELHTIDDIPSDLKLLASKLAPHTSDVPYFALALHLKCAIWSQEKSFKRQSEVKVFSTPELVDVFLR